MSAAHEKPDPTTPRTQPGVPWHVAQATAALREAPVEANGLNGSLSVASIHAQLAIADAIRLQTSVLQSIAALLDPSRGEP